MTNTDIKSYQQVEAEAALDAQRLRFQGASLPGIYVPGSTVAPTREQAVARYYETHPDEYEAYRQAHNAAPLLRQLQHAGVQLVKR